MAARKVTDQLVKEMQEWRARGLTAAQVAKQFRISTDLVYKYTTTDENGKGAAKVIRENKHLSVEELIIKTGMTRKYIQGVLRYGRVEKAQKKGKVITDYELEVKEICRQVEAEKKAKEKYYKEVKKQEIKALKERFKGVCK